MKNYEIKGNAVEVTLENEKVVKISRVYLEKCVANLGIDMDEAILTYLEDEGYLENLDQMELCDQAKTNKSNKVVNAKTDKPKTQKERVAKPQPEKEYIVGIIAEFLEDITDITNLVIENKAKIITFSYKDSDYKLDLVQKRKPKTEK